MLIKHIRHGRTHASQSPAHQEVERETVWKGWTKARGGGGREGGGEKTKGTEEAV